LPWQKLFLPGQRKTVKQWKILVSSWKNNFCCNFLPIGEKRPLPEKNYFCQDGFSMKKPVFPPSGKKMPTLNVVTGTPLFNRVGR